MMSAYNEFGGSINRGSSFERRGIMVGGVRSLVLQLRAGIPTEVSIPTSTTSSSAYRNDLGQPTTVIRLVGFSDVSAGGDGTLCPSTCRGLPLLQATSTQTGSESVIPLLSATSFCTDRPTSDFNSAFSSTVSPSAGVVGRITEGDKIRLLYNPWTLSGISLGTPWLLNRSPEQPPNHLINSSLYVAEAPQPITNDILFYVPANGELALLIQRLNNPNLTPYGINDKTPKLRFYVSPEGTTSPISGDPRRQLLKTGFIDNDQPKQYDAVWDFDSRERWFDICFATEAPQPPIAVLPQTSTGDTAWLSVRIAKTDPAYVARWFEFVTRFATNNSWWYAYPSPALSEGQTLSCAFEISTVLV